MFDVPDDYDTLAAYLKQQSPYDISSTAPTLPGNNPGPNNTGNMVSAAGGVMQAGSQYVAGKTSAQLLRLNATIAGEQAQSELQAGAGQATLYGQHLAQTEGKQAANIGGSNLSASGSPLRAMESTAFLGAQDVATIQANAARKAWGFQTSEQGDLYQAKLAQATGNANAVGSLITTGARAYGNWNTD